NKAPADTIGYISELKTLPGENKIVSNFTQIFLKDTGNKLHNKSDHDVTGTDHSQSESDKGDNLTEVESHYIYKDHEVSSFDSHTKLHLYERAQSRIPNLRNSIIQIPFFSSHQKDFVTYPFNKRDFMVGVMLESVFTNNAYYIRSTAIMYTNLPKFKDFLLPIPSKDVNTSGKVTSLRRSIVGIDKKSIWREVEQSQDPSFIVSTDEYFKDVMLYEKTFNSFSSLLRTLKKYIPQIHEDPEGKKFVFTYKIKPKPESVINFLTRAISVSGCIQIAKPNSSYLESQNMSAGNFGSKSQTFASLHAQEQGNTELHVSEFLYTDKLFNAFGGRIFEPGNTFLPFKLFESRKKETTLQNNTHSKHFTPTTALSRNSSCALSGPTVNSAQTVSSMTARSNLSDFAFPANHEHPKHSLPKSSPTNSQFSTYTANSNHHGIHEKMLLQNSEPQLSRLFAFTKVPSTFSEQKNYQIIYHQHGTSAVSEPLTKSQTDTTITTEQRNGQIKTLMLHKKKPSLIQLFTPQKKSKHESLPPLLNQKKPNSTCNISTLLSKYVPFNLNNSKEKAGIQYVSPIANNYNSTIRASGPGPGPDPNLILSRSNPELNFEQNKMKKDIVSDNPEADYSSFPITQIESFLCMVYQITRVENPSGLIEHGIASIFNYLYKKYNSPTRSSNSNQRLLFTGPYFVVSVACFCLLALIYALKSS
ncbi:hypothetical protein BB560_005033, partial [Smittium megazygosporum]